MQKTIVGTTHSRNLRFRPSNDYGDGNSDSCKKRWTPGTRCVYVKPRRKSPVELQIKKCQPGSFSNYQTTFDKTRCDWCLPGQWQQLEGQTSCYGSPCPDGTYDNSPPNQQASCLICPQHYYSNRNVGTFECDICRGSTNNVNHSGCLEFNCLEGTYFFMNKCLPCPAGTKPHVDHHYCVPCKGNSWSPGNVSECISVEVPRFTRPPINPDKTIPFESSTDTLFFSLHYGVPIWISIFSILLLIISYLLDKPRTVTKSFFILVPICLFISFIVTDEGDKYDNQYAIGMCVFIVVYSSAYIYNLWKKNIKQRQVGNESNV